MESSQDKIPTGSKILDDMLEGGYEQDIVTTVYGPAGAGKTILCILAAVRASMLGKKVIYVDTEGGFSVDRLKQICSHMSQNYLKIINHMTFLHPTNFHEQKKNFETLKNHINDKIGLIIVDSVAMLYRVAMGSEDDPQAVNRELGKQIAYLTEIARKMKIPVLLTNQVYADFDTKEKDKVNMVGGDILKYGSKCLIELQITEQGNRKCILRKHRSIKNESQFMFKIVEGGILGTTENKFRLFR
jgi:DNA repair protein RadB